MPISNEQAREYARRFNEDSNFNRELRQARQYMDHRRANHVTFFMDYAIFSFSRADMERIDQALTAQEQPDPGPETEWHDFITYAITDGYGGIRTHQGNMQAFREENLRTSDLLNSTQARAGRIRGRPSVTIGDAQIAGLQANTIVLDDLIADANRHAEFTWSEPGVQGTSTTNWTSFYHEPGHEPDPLQETQTCRETDPMIYAIPHPFATFDANTEFLFYQAENARQMYRDTVGFGYARANRLLTDSLRPATFQRNETIRALPWPDRSTRGTGSVTLLECTTIYAGLPLNWLPEPVPLADKNMHEVFATSNFDKGVYWQENGTMAVLHGRNDTGRQNPEPIFKVLGQTPEPVHTYFAQASTRITSLADAWSRCSDSWKTWAQEISPYDPDVLLWAAVLVYPHSFGMTRATQFTEMLGNPDLYRLGCLTGPNQVALALAHPTFNLEDKTLTLYRKPADLLNARPTTMRPGKALRTVLPDTDDEIVKRATAELIGNLTPPEFRIGFTKADFDEGYTNGPSSCMTYVRERYRLLRGADADIRPTDAFENGDIGIALMSSGGKVTARTLLVESTKKFVRIYAADYCNERNGESALRAKLEELGYREHGNALVGQVLKKIPIDYTDAENIAEVFHTYWQRLYRYLEVHGFSTPDCQSAMERAELQAYAAPYIDCGNFNLLDTEAGLEVTTRFEDFNTTSVASNIAHAYFALRDSDPCPDRIGRTHYECGGMINGDVGAAARYLWDLKQARDQLRPQPAQPAQPAPPTPEQPLAPPPAPDAVVPFSERLNQYCQDIINNREDPVDDDNVLPVWDSGSDSPTLHALTEDEVDTLETLMDCDTFVSTLTPDSTAVWCDEDETYELGDDRYLTTRSDEYGHVYIERWDEYRLRDDCVELYNDEWAPSSNTVEINEQYYWDDDDDLVWVDRINSHRLRDDCVRAVDDEWEVAADCFRLPNGDFVHEDDLSRVA